MRDVSEMQTAWIPKLIMTKSQHQPEEKYSDFTNITEPKSTSEGKQKLQHGAEMSVHDSFNQIQVKLKFAVSFSFVELF